MMASRRKIVLGNLEIGGGTPVRVQSMAMADTRDVVATVKEIKGLEAEGCEIIRVSVPDKESSEALPSIMKQISIPLIAGLVIFAIRLI